MGRMGWWRGGLAPGLRASPGAGCGEVDVDGDGFGGGLLGLNGAGGRRSGLQERTEAIAELREGVAEREEAVKQDCSSEVESIANGVNVALEGRGLLSPERERDGCEVKAGGAGRRRGLILAALVEGVGSRRRGGADEEIAQRDGFGAESGELKGFVGELEFAGEDGPGQWL